MKIYHKLLREKIKFDLDLTEDENALLISLFRSDSWQSEVNIQTLTNFTDDLEEITTNLLNYDLIQIQVEDHTTYYKISERAKRNINLSDELNNSYQKFYEILSSQKNEELPQNRFGIVRRLLSSMLIIAAIALFFIPVSTNYTLSIGLKLAAVGILFAIFSHNYHADKKEENYLKHQDQIISSANERIHEIRSLLDELETTYEY